MKPGKHLSRRRFLRQSSAFLAVALPAWHLPSAAADAVSAANPSLASPAFELPPLPYAYDALEPFIDAQTMRIHHDRHHRAYADNLNKALANAADWQQRSLDELMRNISQIPEAIRTAVRNNGGGHWNHSFFWNIMTPEKETAPQGRLLEALQAGWGTLGGFQEAFTRAALGVFGSGWAWLLADRNGRLSITTTPNQDNPLMDLVAEKGTPIIGVDVWEHAYYLKHQNRRADYLRDWWQVINWKQAAQNYG